MNDIRSEYVRRFASALDPTARVLGEILHEQFKGWPRIDRVSTRAKAIDSFVKKAKSVKDDGQPKYSAPFEEIQDQIGARIVTFFKSDVDRVRDRILRYYTHIEAATKYPISDWEFNYFGSHFILVVPTEAIHSHVKSELLPQVFELQIKTLFQHAWSEAEHDLGYKPGVEPLTPDQNRRLAFTSAQAWGADRIFDELFQEREKREIPTKTS